MVRLPGGPSGGVCDPRCHYRSARGADEPTGGARTKVPKAREPDSAHRLHALRWQMKLGRLERPVGPFEHPVVFFVFGVTNRLEERGVAMGATDTMGGQAFSPSR